MPAKPRARPVRRVPGTYGPAIAEAVATGDFVAALDQALVLWRSYRQAPVADLVDAIAAKCRPATISAKDSAAFQTAWLDLAHGEPEAVMVGALASSLGKRLPVRDVSYLTPNRDLKRQKPFLDRIAALTKLLPDPRVAKALLDIVEKAPFSESGRVYEPVLALLVELADDRAIPALRRLIERPLAKGSGIRDYLSTALPEAIDEIGKTPRGTLAPDDAEHVDRVLRELGGGSKPVPHRDVEQLFAECLAKPDDDAPRAVLADALLEREDPRGELIALQLRPQLGEAESKRVAALLRKHEKEWLGELHGVTKLRVWRRGFLDEAELQNHAVADDATWKRLVQDPLLATMRTLHKGRANAEIYSSFVLSPAMRALREVTVPTKSLFDKLVELRRPLDHLVFEASWPPTMLASLEVLASHGLRRLTFTGHSSPTKLLETLRAPSKRFAFHTLFSELCVAPGNQAYGLWGKQARTWLTAHAALAPVRRLGIAYNSSHVIAEAGAKQPRFEITVNEEWGLEWTLDQIGSYEHLVVRGHPPARLVRASLRNKIAAIPSSKLDLRDGWAAFRGPSRAPRARRP